MARTIQENFFWENVLMMQTECQKVSPEIRNIRIMAQADPYTQSVEEIGKQDQA